MHLRKPHLHISHIRSKHCQHGLQVSLSPDLTALLTDHPHLRFVVSLGEKKGSLDMDTSLAGHLIHGTSQPARSPSPLSGRSSPLTSPPKPLLLLEHCWNNLQDQPQPSTLRQGMPCGPGACDEPVRQQQPPAVTRGQGGWPPAQGTAAAHALVPWHSGLGWIPLTTTWGMPAQLGAWPSLMRAHGIFAVPNFTCTPK